MKDDRPQEIIDMHNELVNNGYIPAIDLPDKGCFIAPTGETLATTDYESAVLNAHKHMNRAQELALIYKWLDEFGCGFEIIDSPRKGVYRVSTTIVPGQNERNIEGEGATIKEAIENFYKELENEE